MSPSADSGASAPRLSVVIPLYNCLPLTQAIAAALPSTLPRGLAWEAILVDDGSSDGTREWLDTLRPPFQAVRNERNLGYAGANNRGAARARGELLALINNDLVLAPGWLEPMLAAHAALGARAGLVGNVQLDARTGRLDHAGIRVNHQGKPEHDRRPVPAWERLLRPVRPVPALTGACFLVSARLWSELGGFDEGYVNGCEDVDLCFRAAAAGRINAVALRSRVGHRISASPGRKDRDEANTHRLAQRWRETLVRAGSRAWARHYLGCHLAEPRDFPDPELARQAALYLLGLRPVPAGARAGIQVALEVELERWRSLGNP
ncbi:MAG TPA: glycosyltransferase family 2 protein [Opitutaceae bacterium]|nr:glycosyltransferase family 2 protein [Opitutaceae bacterium]